MNKTALNTAIGIALGSALLAATAVEAHPIRFDDGSLNNSASFGSWNFLTIDVDTPAPISLGMQFSFLGGTADGFVASRNGGISLFSGGTLLGSIVGYGVPGPGLFSAEWQNDVFGPVNSVNIGGVDVAITEAFRIAWADVNSSQSQIALFSAANGDAFVEFNYWDGPNFDFGVNIEEDGTPLGVISSPTAELFNLRSYVAANQGACLQTWGAYEDDWDNAPNPDVNLPVPGTGCTGYFPNGDTTGATALLPPAFQVANGGTPNETAPNPVANYRYLVHLGGTTPPPPTTPVPEPTTLTLLLAGLSLTAAARLRKSGRA